MYSLSYDLSINFSEPVKRHNYTLRILPRFEIERESEDLFVNGSRVFETSRDSFQNRLVSGLIANEESEFSVHLDAKVSPLPLLREEGKSEISLGYFRYQSELTKESKDLKNLSLSLAGDTPFSLAESALSLISDNMSYEKGATSVTTTASEALSMRKGVCQDYAHIMLSLLRSRGVICRYVAGLTLGEGESHAWVEVFDSGFWKGFDPTRSKIADESYFPLSYGRDALDSPINSGVYIGIVNSALSVNALCREE